MTVEVSTKGSGSHRSCSSLDTNALSPKGSKTKGLLVWGGLNAVLSLPLSAIHHISNWWLLLIFGVVLPIALGLGNRIANSRKIQAHSVDHSSERELLEVLERHGGITPLTAASRTSLDRLRSRSHAERTCAEGPLGGAGRRRKDKLLTMGADTSRPAQLLREH
jgi:hypothetical protein